MLMPGRLGEAGNSSYTYGFQGQEKDDEIKGKGNSVNYKYRMHDPRLGRFFAVDPLSPEYPHNSPYAFSENRLLDGVELEGLEFAGFNEDGTQTSDIENAFTIEYQGYDEYGAPIGGTFNNFTTKDGTTYSSTIGYEYGDCDCQYARFGGLQESVRITRTDGFIFSNNYVSYSATINAGIEGNSQMLYSGTVSSEYYGAFNSVAIEKWVKSNNGGLAMKNSLFYKGEQAADRRYWAKRNSMTGAITMVDGPETLFGPGILKAGVLSFTAIRHYSLNKMATSLVFNRSNYIYGVKSIPTMTRYTVYPLQRNVLGQMKPSGFFTGVGVSPTPLLNSLGGGTSPIIQLIPANTIVRYGIPIGLGGAYGYNEYKKSKK